MLYCLLSTGARLKNMTAILRRNEKDIVMGNVQKCCGGKMKKLMITLLAVALVSSLCFAEEKGGAASPTSPSVPSKEEPSKKEAPAKKEAPSVPTTGNSVKAPATNVVKMDKEGKKTALCCCLHEFSVSNTAPVVTNGATDFYMCGEGCAEVSKKATKEENEKSMAAWSTKYSTYTLASNATESEGKKVAKCVCGAEFTVTDKSLSYTENGVTIYLCGEGCSEKFKATSAADRQVAEIGYVSMGK
jgi:hypothetical protein